MKIFWLLRISGFFSCPAAPLQAVCGQAFRHFLLLFTYKRKVVAQCEGKLSWYVVTCDADGWVISHAGHDVSFRLKGRESFCSSFHPQEEG